MKVSRILVATDVSVAGNRAVTAAAERARAASAALRIVHVAPSRRMLAGLWGSSTSAMHDVQRQAAVALRHLADSIDPARQLELSTGVVTGPATRKIISAVSDYGADLLVIGAHGEQEMTIGQPGLGGTANKLVTAASCPLWLVRKPLQDVPTDGVIAAVDLGELSVSVLQWAAWHAAGSQLHVLHAYDVPFASRLETYGFSTGTLDVYTEAEQERLDRELGTLIAAADCDSSVERIIERGDAASRLFAQIRRLKPAVVVVGKHGVTRRRIANTKFGSVCRYAAFFSPTDVLIVPRRAVAVA